MSIPYHPDQLRSLTNDMGAVTIDPFDNIIRPEESDQERAVTDRLGIGRKIVFKEYDPTTYGRQMDKEVAMHEAGQLKLGEMTPSYAHAMVLNRLKKARVNVSTFKQEMDLAKLWKTELGELAAAFGLPEDHFSIDTSGPVVHVHPVEESGQTLGPNGHPLHFDILEQSERFPRSIPVGRGFEAILPTHIQSTGYATSAHPEMDANMSPEDSIPSLQIGKYVRIGGAWNPGGCSKWKFGDHCWLGQNCYMISQEHDASRLAQDARTRSSTSFPGMEVGEWAWVAKGAQLLYRTLHVGRGSVVGAAAKINTWVSDCALVAGEDRQYAFYPEKAWVLDTLGIKSLKGVLSLDWARVEAAWQQAYSEWRMLPQVPDAHILRELQQVREDARAARVLFIGNRNAANILAAADAKTGKNPLRRIDVMTEACNRPEQAYTMQALNGLRNTTTRFRAVDSLANIPIGAVYEEPQYDVVVIETAASNCCRSGAYRVFEEAQRLVRPGGKIVAELYDVSSVGAAIELPEYVSRAETMTEQSDKMALHIQAVAQGSVR